MADVRGYRSSANAAKLGAGSPPPSSRRASTAASSMAMHPPCPRLGVVGWAASPISTARPDAHTGVGGRSTMSLRSTAPAGVTAISSGTGSAHPRNTSATYPRSSPAGRLVLRRPPIDAVARQGSDPEPLPAAPPLARVPRRQSRRARADPPPAGIASVPGLLRPEQRRPDRRADPVGADHHVRLVGVPILEPDHRSLATGFAAYALEPVAGNPCGQAASQGGHQLGSVDYGDEGRDPEPLLECRGRVGGRYPVPVADPELGLLYWQGYRADGRPGPDVIQRTQRVGPEADAGPNLSQSRGALVDCHPDPDAAEGERR